MGVETKPNPKNRIINPKKLNSAVADMQELSENGMVISAFIPYPTIDKKL